jgi:hypothetical protein
MRNRSLFLLCAAIAFHTLPAWAGDVWTDFYRDAKLICPSHHLEWLPDIWADLPSEFEHTLPTALRHRIVASEDFGTCSKETMGFYCEGSVSMTAYQRAGILKYFIRYACKHFVCTEGSICPVNDYH